MNAAENRCLVVFSPANRAFAPPRWIIQIGFLSNFWISTDEFGHKTIYRQKQVKKSTGEKPIKTASPHWFWKISWSDPGEHRDASDAPLVLLKARTVSPEHWHSPIVPALCGTSNASWIKSGRILLPTLKTCSLTSETDSYVVYHFLSTCLRQ